MEVSSNIQNLMSILEKNGITKFFHFTDRSNLTSIVEHGGLYSWKEIQKNGIQINKSGGDELSHSLDSKAHLDDYVRLSFCNKHPMLFSALNDGRINDPVILEINPLIISFSDCKFSNTNAVRSGAQILSGECGLSRVHFSSVKNGSVFDLEEDERPFYQAEVLVKSFVPIGFILNINDVCPDSLNKHKANYILDKTDGVKKYEMGKTLMYLNQTAEAYDCFQTAANLGNACAQCELGTFFRKGVAPCQKDLVKAYYWYKKSAEQGNAEGLFFLSMAYKKGDGVSRNAINAEYYNKISAMLGDEKAQYSEGLGYVRGILNLDTGRSIEKDTIKAYGWFMKSAEQGYHPAQYKIGQFWETGTPPCEKNLEKALEWYQKAVQNGSLQAIFSIGQIYSYGIDETNPDDAMANTFFLIAAHRGHVQSMYKIGINLYYGKGILQDKEEAKVWLSRAAEEHNKKACEFIRKLNNPTRSDIDQLDTSVLNEELADAQMDPYGVLYSRDGKKLIGFGEGEVTHSSDYQFFYHNKLIRKYCIPEGVEVVCKYAFMECESLEEIVFPSSVVKIGDSAFYCCSNLKKVVLNDGLMCIGDFAFYGCKRLVDMVVPRSVVGIGEGVFSQTVSIKSDSSIIKVIDGCLYDDSGENLICFLNDGRREFVVPQFTKSIEPYAFKGSSLIRIVLNEGLEQIKNSAFTDCVSLRTINLPNTVTNIGDVCFAGCRELSKVVIPPNVQKIESCCFEMCTKLSEVVLHDDITIIETYAFSGCNVSKICLPRNLELLKPMAFGDSLREISSNSSKFIVKDGVVFSEDMTTLVQYYGTGNTYNVPYGVKEVLDGAFADRWIEDEIVFPDTVKTVGKVLFLKVPAPKRIVIPSELKSQMLESVETYYQDRIVEV